MKNRVLNVIGLLMVLTINGLANALPINGYTTGELSAMYPNLFVPAGFTFSIWGVIYLLLILWVGYFLIPYDQKAKEYDETKIGKLFFVSCLLNAAWILAWHYQLIELSLLIMLGILGSLLWMYRGIADIKFHWIVKVPISIYLGWISVATIANSTALLVYYGIDGGSNASAYSTMMVLIASILGLFFAIVKKDIFYALVIIWALFGIQSRHDFTDIQIATVTGMVVLSMVTIYRAISKEVYPMASNSTRN